MIWIQYFDDYSICYLRRLLHFFSQIAFYSSMCCFLSIEKDCSVVFPNYLWYIQLIISWTVEERQSEKSLDKIYIDIAMKVNHWIVLCCTIDEWEIMFYFIYKLNCLHLNWWSKDNVFLGSENKKILYKFLLRTSLCKNKKCNLIYIATRLQYT